MGSCTKLPPPQPLLTTLQQRAAPGVGVLELPSFPEAGEDWPVTRRKPLWVSVTVPWRKPQTRVPGLFWSSPTEAGPSVGTTATGGTGGRAGG